MLCSLRLFGLSLITQLILTAPYPRAALAQQLGKGLRPGLRLTYENPSGQDIWQIDSVRHDLALGDRTGCTLIVLRTGVGASGTGSSQRRQSCVRGDTVFTWRAAEQLWRADRVIGEHATLEIPRPTGMIRYTTGALGQVTVGGVSIQVIATRVETIDSTGQVVRRLREQYAPDLGTAVEGVFEVPDGSGGWRAQLRFRLIGLDPPP